MQPGNYHVLLVDDDPAMLRILAKWLEKAGYPVRTADNGREALRAINEQCPHFLITDWEMPEMNGLELCRRVRQMSLPHYVYILFLTVKSAPAEMIEGLNGGADDFIGKPVRQEEMLARLRVGFRVLDLERRLGEMTRTDRLTGPPPQHAFHEPLHESLDEAKDIDPQGAAEYDDLFGNLAVSKELLDAPDGDAAVALEGMAAGRTF
jgi:two-component system, cell cycle response regulator